MPNRRLFWLIVIAMLSVVTILELAVMAIRLPIPHFLSVALPIIYVVLLFAFESERIDPAPVLAHPRNQAEWKALERYVSRNENSILLSGAIFVTGFERTHS